MKKTDVQIAQLIGYNKNRDSSFETFVRDVISMKVVEGEFIIPGYQLRGYFKDFDCSVRSVALNETTGVYYYESEISKSRGKRLLQGFEWDSIHVFDSLVDDTLLLLLHEAKTAVEVADISETFQRLDKTVTFLQMLAAGNLSVQISFSPKLPSVNLADVLSRWKPFTNAKLKVLLSCTITPSPEMIQRAKNSSMMLFIRNGNEYSIIDETGKLLNCIVTTGSSSSLGEPSSL